MQKAEVEQLVNQLLRDWFDSRIVKNAALGSVVDLQHAVIQKVADLAFKHSNELREELVASAGIDLHKIASAVARALNAHPDLFMVRHGQGYSADDVKLGCIIDCSLSVFLSILRCDRKSIESETNTWAALRKLFSKHSNTSLLSLAMIAFLLEKTYPEV
ncbi:MAG: hypothetical protein WC091_11755 [Sulfuricellaceae bacterium]